MRTGVALTAVLVLASAPVAADEGPQVTDPCGDTVLRAYVADVGETTAPDPRDRPMDIRSVTFTSVFDNDEVFLGMDVAVRFCHEASLPADDDHLVVAWDLTSGCHGAVELFGRRDLPAGDAVVVARYVRNCPHPLLPNTHYFLGLEPLDLVEDLVVAGEEITFRLRLDRFHPLLAGDLRPGTVWRAPGAATSGTDGLTERYTTPAGVRPVAVTAAGTTVVLAPLRDEAGPGRDVIVGD